MIKYDAFIIGNLHKCWNEQVEAGLITRNEMYDSLHAQITGELDLSPDELTDDRARMMGWDINNMTDNQWSIWKHIVNKAAEQWVTK